MHHNIFAFFFVKNTGPLTDALQNWNYRSAFFRQGIFHTGRKAFAHQRTECAGERGGKGAEIGTQAMLYAMAGAGIRPEPLQAALLGAAAILEIIHPDAEAPEGQGQYGRTTSVRLVGRSAARRTVKLVKKYWSFDAYTDVTVTMGDQKAVMKGFIHDVIPKVCQGQCQDVAWAVPFAAAVMDDLSLSGCNILNVVIPAAVASAMKLDTPEAIAGEAEPAAYITVGIPGAKAHATEVGKMALEIINYMELRNERHSCLGLCPFGLRRKQ